MRSAAVARRMSTADVADLLAGSVALGGAPPLALHKLAATASVVLLPDGVALAPGLARQPLVVGRGALLVQDPAGRPVDIVGRGVLRPPDGSRPVVARGPTQVVVLSLRSLRRAAAATPPAGLRNARAEATRLRSLAGEMADAAFDPPEHAGEAIDQSAPAVDALGVLLETGADRLVVTDRGQPVGVLRSDVFATVGSGGLLPAVTWVDAARAASTLAGVRARLRGAPEALLDAGADAGEVGRLLSAFSDRLMRRLLQLAVVELGPAPAPFAWLVFGSQARREQTLTSDQDTGLAYPAGLSADARRWYARLGAWMTTALEACGYPRCPGKVTADDPAWRHDVQGWAVAVRLWTDRAAPDRLLGADIGLDVRVVGGGLDIAGDLTSTIRRAARNELTLARLAAEAVRHPPPLTVFRRLALERSGPARGTFLAKRALQPIVDLARLSTLSRGGTEVGTVARLAAATGTDLPVDLAAELRCGFDLLLRLRLTAVSRTGRVDAGALDVATRRSLRQCFVAIDRAQQLAAARHRLPPR